MTPEVDGAAAVITCEAGGWEVEGVAVTPPEGRDRQGQPFPGRDASGLSPPGSHSPAAREGKAAWAGEEAHGLVPKIACFPGVGEFGKTPFGQEDTQG